ncbi:hypothetical protein BGY98DRAFT_703643 [Russula aff. rugulosa BPL654]|nr:hypothetical protein BGY98DRAFT_703643 [Russula aff. rugulosa BPL654]
MRRYCIASGILLILPIIDFAVTAPVLVQQKSQAGVHVVHITDDAMTMLGKRGDDVDEILLKLFGPTGTESRPPARPEEPPAARPSSSSQLSGPTDVGPNVEQPPPSILGEPSQVASLGHAPPIPGDDELNKLWLDLYGHRFFDESLAAPPSWGSHLSGPAHGWMDIEQPVASIHKEPSPVASPGHAPPIPGDDELNKLWLDLYGHRFFDESLAAPPSWGSHLSGPAHGWMDIEQQVPSIHKEPSQVASSGHAPPIPGDDELNKLWLDLYGHRFFDESLAAPPPWASSPSGPSHGWTDVEQPDHAPPSPVSSALSSTDHVMMGAQTLPNPGTSTASDHVMMDVGNLSHCLR